MPQHYVVPNIYQDMSNQYQGYFAFRFVCQRCYWQIDTKPITSKVSTATNIIDLGAGFLNGFWGRAAEMGEKVYGSQWHTEQAEALQKAWAEVQQYFRTCPKCSVTVCTRCYNPQVNLCVGCAPNLKADGAHFQHDLNIEAQRAQIQQQYNAPQFHVHDIPSAVTPDIATPVARQIASAPQQAASQGVACPSCQRIGLPGKFCQDCGTRLPAVMQNCPQCSAPTNGTRFCAECGARLT